jgi:hypothetical protein
MVAVFVRSGHLGDETVIFQSVDTPVNCRTGGITCLREGWCRHGLLAGLCEDRPSVLVIEEGEEVSGGLILGHISTHSTWDNKIWSTVSEPETNFSSWARPCDSLKDIREIHGIVLFQLLQ